MFASTAVLNGTVTELKGDMVKVLATIESLLSIGLDYTSEVYFSMF